MKGLLTILALLLLSVANVSPTLHKLFGLKSRLLFGGSGGGGCPGGCGSGGGYGSGHGGGYAGGSSAAYSNSGGANVQVYNIKVPIDQGGLGGGGHGEYVGDVHNGYGVGVYDGHGSVGHNVHGVGGYDGHVIGGQNGHGIVGHGVGVHDGYGSGVHGEYGIGGHRRGSGSLSKAQSFSSASSSSSNWDHSDEVVPVHSGGGCSTCGDKGFNSGGSYANAQASSSASAGSYGK